MSNIKKNFSLNKNDIDNLKDKIKTNSYIGKKGYSIPKKLLNDDELYKLKRELSVKPFAPPTSIQRPKEFMIFRESSNKIYIPRFYGIEKFGIPNKNTIQEGDNINITFNGKLRDYQENVVSSYIEQAKKTGGGLIDVPCGYGKCLAKNTKILMYDGSIKKVQNIKVGDILMGDDNTKRNVLSITTGYETMYRITSNKNDCYVVNESHILSLMCVSYCKVFDKIYYPGDVIDIPILDYIKLMYYDVNKYFKGYKVGIHLNDSTPGYTTSELDNSIDIYDINTYNFGYMLGIYYIQKLNNKNSNNNVSTKLEFDNIPNIYKYGNRFIQMSLIFGIIDSNCCIFGDYYTINIDNKNLIRDLLYVVRCIGIKCYIYCNTLYIYKGINKYTKEHCSKDYKFTYKDYVKFGLITDIRIKKLYVDQYYGFTIDNNHRFVLGDFTVTHNTVMGLNIIEKLQKKTLIIVHKEFLMNQWIERIEQYLPDANVGKIQGKIVDIDNKDIVIGMLQSLSMKDYNDNIFDSFGFTLIDECFPYNTELITNKGKMKIGDIYKLWSLYKNSNIELPQILSYNIKKQKYEYKELLYSWEKTTNKLVNIELLDNTTINCTEKHLLLTTNGYTPANKLTINDILITANVYIDSNKNNYENIIKLKDIYNKNYTLKPINALNKDCIQIILGSLLSGSVNIKRLYNNRYLLNYNKESGIHIRKYPLYSWKNKMLNIDDDTYLLFDCNILVINPIDNTIIIDDNFIANIDLRSFYIWLLEKGSITDYKTIIINIDNINYNYHNILLRIFTNLNLNVNIYFEYIELDEDSTTKLITYLKPFNIRKFVDKNVYSYKWSNIYSNYKTVPIYSIITDNIINNINVYDIEVKDNHNFILMNKIPNLPNYNNDNQYKYSYPIVHNCHHIGAEVFSRSLFKIVTKYMMGLSATMDRKDGLTHVFKKFIGDVAYKLERDNSDEHVLVKTIKYYNDDEEFSNVELNYKGQVHYSVMISKICQFNLRSEFIIKVLEYELKLHPEQQVMILAHNKSLLKYLFEAIQHRNIATVGYYVGGMKEKALKETENKQVVIATYAMAEEALDIKTLSALILATPRTNVTQAVGRILRIKHKNPVVYDIIDQHDFFKVQYYKRQKFYKKCKYRILQTDDKTFLSNNYDNEDYWKVIYDPIKNNIIKETNIPTKSLLKGKCLL
jgi:superfamily II DNA or RNA helicase